jgi:hypothetical protein
MPRRHRAHCAVSAAKPFALPFAALRIPKTFSREPRRAAKPTGAKIRPLRLSPREERQATDYRRLQDMGSGCLLDRFRLAGDQALLVRVCCFRFWLLSIQQFKQRSHRLPPLDAADTAPFGVG